MNFIGLKPWDASELGSTIETVDGAHIFDLHADWLLSKIVVENHDRNSSLHLLFNGSTPSDVKAFELSFSEIKDFSVLAEFGAANGPYDHIEEFRYWESDGLGYIEFFGAMRQIHFTFSAVELILG